MYLDGLRLLGGFHTLRGRENDIMRKLETIGHEQYVINTAESDHFHAFRVFFYAKTNCSIII